MANPDYPQQQTPERVRTAEKPPRNDTGDLALLAEFYAEKLRQKAESASDNTKRTTRKNADEMARVHNILLDLVNERFNTPAEADEMLKKLEQGYVDNMDEALSNEEEEENDSGLSAVRRARTFLEQNQNLDIYYRKDFSDWLTARNTRLKEERQKQNSQRTSAESTNTARQVEAAYNKLDVESPTEREKSREKAVELVLQDGGVNIHMSVTRDFSTQEYPNSGFQNLTTRMLDRTHRPSEALGGIEQQLVSVDDSMRGKRRDDILKEHGLKEIIDIRRVKKPVYETVTIPGKKGVFGIGKTQDRTDRRTTGGYEPTLHNEIVSGGKKESAMRFTYYIPQSEWRDYSGRSGQMMSVEIVLPESTAIQLEQILERDPAAMRKIVERVMKEKVLKDPGSWETPQGSGDSLRPPYDRWDAEPDGGKIYIQREGTESGFHQDRVRKVIK